MDFKSSITTSDEALRLQMQDDGNLVLYDLKAKLPIWATMQMIPKHGDFTAQAIILDNGKFVVNQVNESGAKPIWTSTLDVLWPTRAPYCISVSSIPTRFGVTVYDSSCQVLWRSRPPTKKDIQVFIDASTYS
ncbi:hypothetical protein LEN26_003677 [Aphanomyces euteiches]|nr:hypothetical protein AeMF1_014489 [Aphanomyces euteiches]KAH9152670.1 hypothetical protein LEN26_003677 [Aphanomyces euteiches]KAH9196826.1 hypothetical protein AeNC1_001207 [Aphanomyces euteiches]